MAISYNLMFFLLVLQVGSLPVCYLYDLKPGTIYYAAVGIWKDKNFLEYEETSEIISFKTLGIHN